LRGKREEEGKEGGRREEGRGKGGRGYRRFFHSILSLVKRTN